MDNEFKIISRAIQLVELGKFNLAIDLIEENFNALEGLGPLHQMLAFCYLQIEENDKAILSLNMALEKNPEDEGNQVLLGAAYSAKGDLDLAIDSFKTCLELNPDTIDAHVGLARLYLIQEKTQFAKVHIDHAIKLDPNNEQALHIKSVFEKLLGYDKESRATLLKGLEINPLNKSLLFEKANRDLYNDDPANAQEIYQQLILENPDNYLLEQKIIESRLSQNWFYRNLLFKFRLFQSASYLMVLFILAFILFSGGYYSSLEQGSQAQIVWKYVFLSVGIWSAIFWIGRLLSHSWLANKIWNKPISYFLNQYFAIEVYTSLALLFFTLYLFLESGKYFTIAGFLAFFAVLYLGFIIIENKKIRLIYSIWFTWLHIAGLITFIYPDNKPTTGFFNKLISSGDLLAFSILIPFAMVILYVAGKGYYDDWVKGKKKKTKEEEAKELDLPKWHIAMYFGLFVLFISLRFAYSFIGQNILNPLLFYAVWLLIPIALLIYFYKSGKVDRWFKHNLAKFKYDANYVSSFFLMSCILTFMASILIGFLAINFIVFNKSEFQTKLLSNGMLQEDSKAFLMIEYEGFKEKIRPLNLNEFPSVDTGDVILKVHQSLFGVTMVDSIFLKEASLEDD